MPKIHDFDLPEELRAELEALALNIEAKEAVEIARSLPKHFKGFAVSRNKADLLKSRLSQCAWTLKELDSALRLALAGAGLGRTLVAVLSAEALQHGLDGWLGCFGREGMLLGMLLDEREEVRKIAHPELCVDLFFDSREINDQNFSERVRLVFSGGDQVEHRADDAILAHLEHLRRNEGKVCRLLVTSDRELAQAAGEGGTRVVNIEQLAVLLPLGQV